MGTPARSLTSKDGYRLWNGRLVCELRTTDGGKTWFVLPGQIDKIDRETGMAKLVDDVLWTSVGGDSRIYMTALAAVKEARRRNSRNKRRAG